MVNEALNEDGTMRQSPWYHIIGPDFVAQAFAFAREADPTVELYYNDYAMENAQKRAGGLRLVKSLLDQRRRTAAPMSPFDPPRILHSIHSGQGCPTPHKSPSRDATPRSSACSSRIARLSIG